MRVEGMPFCCTSSVLGMFGDHGEEALVTVEEIKKLLAKNKYAEFIDEPWPIPQKYVYASTVNPVNVKILKEAGFKVLDSYPGQQGQVYVMGLHLPQHGMQ
jgi:hypothetical protein